MTACHWDMIKIVYHLFSFTFCWCTEVALLTWAQDSFFLTSTFHNLNKDVHISYRYLNMFRIFGYSIADVTLHTEYLYFCLLSEIGQISHCLLCLCISLYKESLIYNFASKLICDWFLHTNIKKSIVHWYSELHDRCLPYTPSEMDTCMYSLF